MGNPEESFPQVNVCKTPVTGSDNCRVSSNSESCENKSAIDTNSEDFSLTLDLSSKCLSEFPGNCLNTLGSCVVHLKIEYNDISDIPCGLSKQLPHLQTLYADGNRLSGLPGDIGELISLRELVLCENKLVCLPESLCKLKQLKILKVSSNCLRQLHSEIGQNCALEEIHADENKLKRLPATLGLLKQLSTLIVSDNKIEQLLSTIGQCESLKVVDFSRNRINHIPESFGDLKNLTRIDLSENKIGGFCAKFSSCSSLEKLYLDLNKLARFPSWFSDLERIQEISMNSNDLAGAAIPEGFGIKCQNLRFLDLRGNFIEVLPESFGCLSSLQVCLLGTPLGYLERSPNFQNGNWLINLPKSFSNLSALTKICVEENQVVALPSEIGNLVNLEDLYFGSNMLSELPPSFTKLLSLKRCQLSKNRLKRLPEDFGVLSTLTELYLDSNMLRNLPLSMCNLVNLEVLDLTENKLKDVPTDVLASLTKLKALNMFFNKFKVPHSEIPYIVKRTHYAEKNPEFKNTWRGKNNSTKSMSQVFQDGNLPQVSPESSKFLEKDPPDSDDDNAEDGDSDGNDPVADADSSADEDWDAQIASSSASSELANYIPATSHFDDDEDWDKEVRPNPSRQLSSDKEEGQFDLDDDDNVPGVRPVLPSPVRFDQFGNSSRPIDFAVHYHRQTPYIYHAPRINRYLYVHEPSVEGQFDSDIEQEDGQEMMSSNDS